MLTQLCVIRQTLALAVQLCPYNRRIFEAKNIILSLNSVNESNQSADDVQHSELRLRTDQRRRQQTAIARQRRSVRSDRWPTAQRRHFGRCDGRCREHQPSGVQRGKWPMLYSFCPMCRLYQWHLIELAGLPLTCKSLVSFCSFAFKKPLPQRSLKLFLRRSDVIESPIVQNDWAAIQLQFSMITVLGNSRQWSSHLNPNETQPSPPYSIWTPAWLISKYIWFTTAWLNDISIVSLLLVHFEALFGSQPSLNHLIKTTILAINGPLYSEMPFVPNLALIGAHNKQLA